MSESNQPATLLDLLKALERSRNLRTLARECGLTVRELRRRLNRWSREVAAEASGEVLDPDADRQIGKEDRRPQTENESWPALTPAKQLKRSPLPAKGSRVLEAWTDGASRGNPGPAAIGIVFRQKQGEPLCSHAETIGRATNNVAEYRAVVRALEFCRSWRIKKLDLYLDSELIARQLNGVYRVKSQTLLPLYQRAVFLARGFQSFGIHHVPRQKNAHADYLASRVLASKRSRRSSS
jgi:ribonuclease HI